MGAGVLGIGGVMCVVLVWFVVLIILWGLGRCVPWPSGLLVMGGGDVAGVAQFELGMGYGMLESEVSISCWCAFIVIERFECERFRWPRIIKEMGLF